MLDPDLLPPISPPISPTSAPHLPHISPVSPQVLAGSTMLDPDFLGLPPGTEGVPFLMAMVQA
jgi:hypothetical protein